MVGAGLVAAAMGAEHVSLTDLPAVLPVLTRNAQRSCGRSSGGSVSGGGGGRGGGGGGGRFNRRALRELPAALRGAERWAELAELLCSLPWLRAQLRGMGIGAVLDDLELPPPQGRQEAAAAAQLAALGAALRQALE